MCGLNNSNKDRILGGIFGPGYTGGANSASSESSSGGIGFGLPATKKSQSTRMARTASSANFMALFGPQTGATQ